MAVQSSCNLSYTQGDVACVRKGALARVNRGCAAPLPPIYRASLGTRLTPLAETQRVGNGDENEG